MSRRSSVALSSDWVRPDPCAVTISCPAGLICVDMQALVWSVALLISSPASAEQTPLDPFTAFLPRGAPVSVPREEIRGGGPTVDGIPALVRPRRYSTAEADRALKPGDPVLGLEIGDESVAYPIRLLNWHELVNDEVGGIPVAVTYCPLCRSGIVFDRRAGDAVREFGVSGLLYNSDLVMYDRGTRSLWSQIMAEAIAGPSTGAKLLRLPAVRTNWARWKAAHPGTKAVLFDTGHSRDYGADPYAGYGDSPALIFPVSHEDARLPRKTVVFGVSLPEGAAAVPVAALRGGAVIRTRLGKRTVAFQNDGGARAFDEEGRELAGLEAYWFAWAAFHSRTLLVGAEKL